eukprot:g1211.t1
MTRPSHYHMLLVVVLLALTAVTASASCSGSSAGLHPDDCAAFQAGYAESTNHGPWRSCATDVDPCKCDKITCENSGGATRITRIWGPEFSSHYHTSNSTTFGNNAPISWGQLTHLTRLGLYNVNMRGTVPVEFSALTALTKLQLTDNYFTGTLPVQWSSLSRLTHLKLSSMARNLPEFYPSGVPVAGRTVDPMLVGALPSQWSTMTDLEECHIDRLGLTGSLPPEWGAWTKIRTFQASHNRMFALTGRHDIHDGLTGTLPASYSRWTNLARLELQHNNIGGTLPPEWHAIGNAIGGSCASTQYVKLQGNAIGSTLPTAWANWTCLEYLILYRNDLSGTLPPEWGQTGMRLWTLDLGANRFSGTLPPDWSGLDRVQRLVLEDNMFTGSIPDAWCDTTDGMQQMRTGVNLFTVRFNRLTGTIPACFNTWDGSSQNVDLEGNPWVCQGTKSDRSAAFPDTWKPGKNTYGRWGLNNGYANDGDGGLGETDGDQVRKQSFRSDNAQTQTENYWVDCCPSGKFTPNPLMYPVNLKEQLRCWPKSCVEGIDFGCGEARGSQFGTAECPDDKFFSCRDCFHANGTVVANADCDVCDCGKKVCGFGQYLSDANGECLDCPGGKYADVLGQENCISCPTGRYSGPKATMCQSCPPGHFDPSGVNALLTLETGCTICPRGKFQASAEQIRCDACACIGLGDGERTDTAQAGATSSDQCVAPGSGGKVCPAGQQGTAGSACQNCTAGRFKSTNSSYQCEQCACGTFSLAGASSCGTDVCPVGQYGDPTSGTCEVCPAEHFCLNSTKQPFLKATKCIPGEFVARAPAADTDRVCVPCAAGQFSNGSNAPSCTECPSGRYQREAGRSYCDTCPVNSVFSNATGDCVCTPKHFLCPAEKVVGQDCGDEHLSSTDRAKHKGTCISCELYARGANCSRSGLTLATLESDEDHWRATSATAVFHPCATWGGKCIGGAIDGDQGRDGQCGLGRAGPLCTACGPGLVRGTGGKCTVCSAAEGPGMLVLALVLLVALIAVVAFALRSSWLQHALEERAVKARILFGFVQVLSRVNVSYRLQLPVEVVRLLETLAYLEIFDLAALFGSLRCVVGDFSYIDRVYVHTCSATVLLAVIGVVAALAPFKATRTAASNALLLISFVTYPSVVTTLFNVFGCTTFEDGRSYLDVDRSIDCHSERYERVSTFAFVMAPLFAIGIPLVYAMLLARKRARLNPQGPATGTALSGVAFVELRRRNDPAIQHLAFLWRGYAPNMWWFEVFEMVRKFLLVGGPILLRFALADADKASVVYGLVMTVLTSAVMSLGDPYLQKKDEWTMALSQTCFFFALIAGNLVELLGPSANNVASVMVFSTAVPATMLMVFAVLFPRTHDQWMTRKKNVALASAIDTLPGGLLPPSMSSVDVAHAVSTMNQREIKAMLKKPGLEAALLEVFSGRDTSSLASATSEAPKKIVL